MKARCFSAKFNGMIGTDIIEIERVRKSAENESFLAGAFTAAEREYYESHGKRAERWSCGLRIWTPPAVPCVMRSR